MYKPSEEKKDYNCPTCKAQWTQLEVLDKVGPMGFECHRCGGLLEREEAKDGASTGHEKQSKLMSQLDGLLKMLQQIDAEDIPNNDFDTAFALAVPIPRDETVNPSQHFRPLATVGGPPAAVKGDVQLVAAQLDVSVTTNSERTAAEKAADAQRKADIAAQNVLPVWHTNSTVTGERMVADRKDSEQSVNGSSLLKEEEEDKKDSNGLNNELATYYAQLAKEKEQEAREDLEADESSSDDDDEGDFEDVGIGGSGLGTPSSSMSADINASQTRPLNGNVYRKASESGSSAPTHASTPTDTGAVGEDDEAPIAKKVKFESQVNGIKPSAEAEVDKDSDEDEEAEFEDAL
jgi:transcription initiation factor TFIIE subunit alpha